MKKRNIFYLVLLIFSIMMSSCASYETKSKKNSSSNRHIYNKTASKKNQKRKKTTTASSKKKKTVTLKSNKTASPRSSDVKLVLTEAEKYKGTPYRYGGNTSSGIDCSGLVCNAFQKAGVKLPRRSIDISNKGSSVSISSVKEGDLLFFATGGGSINHVGIVYNIVSSGEIFFIHASTSKGVIVSSLKESYWKGKFVKAKRVL
ncbi:MAG: C40 family peptidase [Flavobacteriaceae bacterium]|nr:C40 family peptidase [Flavobacteriaceae bacterium]